MSCPESVVFDAEPLVAFAADEPGSDAVSDYLDAVARGDSDGSVNLVNATEVHYVLARNYDGETAETFLQWLRTIGVAAVDARPVWEAAAEHVVEHNPALGDAFALATAGELGATLLAGADDDYDDVTSVEIERFREHGV